MKSIIDNPLVNAIFEEIKEQYSLTKREIEVLKVLSIQGVSNRSLGEILFMAEKTVKNHIASIANKLNVRSSREIQALVFRDTLLPFFFNLFESIENDPRRREKNEPKKRRKRVG